jgi:putative Ca2+/H+ antiporter (TMEM165/GDT1 family)
MTPVIMRQGPRLSHCHSSLAQFNASGLGAQAMYISYWMRLMDWKIFLTIFASVFIAELGDKTQLATMLFASDKEVSKYTVFLAASAALVVASAIGVLAGSLLAEYINTKYLHYIAGIGFIGIGIFTLYNA